MRESRAEMGENMVVIENVSKAYDDGRPVLEACSLKAGNGEIYALAAGVCMAAVRIGFWKKSLQAVIVSALILAAPVTNLTSVSVLGEFGLLLFAVFLAGVFIVNYQYIKKKIENMEVL